MDQCSLRITLRRKKASCSPGFSRLEHSRVVSSRLRRKDVIVRFAKGKDPLSKRGMFVTRSLIGFAFGSTWTQFDPITMSPAPLVSSQKMVTFVVFSSLATVTVPPFSTDGTVTSPVTQTTKIQPMSEVNSSCIESIIQLASLVPRLLIMIIPM